MGNKVQFIQSKLFNFVVFGKYCAIKLSQRNGGGVAANSSARRRRRVKKVVAAAMKHELYRTKFDEAGLDPSTVDSAQDLVKLPPLTKNEYREMIAEALDADTEGQYRYCHKDHTSGSTGIPLQTCLTVSEYATVVAELLYVLNRNGYRLFLDSSLDMSSPVHAGTRKAKSFLQRFGLLRKAYVSTMDPPEEIIAEINRFKPTEMVAGKSVLHSVLQYASEHGLKIHPAKFIVNTAEPMDDRSAELIEQFFGDKALIDTYATIEAGILAYTMRGNRHKFHLLNSLYDYSVRNEDGEPVDNGELFVTNLFLRQFPMINYKQGDYVDSYVDENGVRYLTRVYGRNDDYIVTESGEWFSFHSLFAFLPRCDYLEQYRVIQEDVCHLKLVLAPRKAASINQEEVEAEFTEKLNLYLRGANMNYEFEWVDEIPQDENGKIRVLISKVK